MHQPFGQPFLLRSLERDFWDRVRQGASTEDAAAGAGVSASAGRRWFRQRGGVTPDLQDQPSGRYLSLAEREEIMILRGQKLGVRAIAARLGRSPSTISRELRRHSSSRGYRASLAQSRAEQRARRPKQRKLARCPALAEQVQAWLLLGWSPEQISHRLRRANPDDEGMQVSHEAIYQSLYVQGRGGLRRELTACLRTGRALRRPARRVDARRTRIPDMVMISERPAEADDRAVPGHWEGDLIIGKDSGSAIGTLVERSTRFVLLLHLPHDHGAVSVRDAVIDAMIDLPAALRRSLTWDQGIELARHTQITIATDLDVYFCDPHSPWQRGSNENTNGLLRQFFPKGTDLSVHDKTRLEVVADLLNGRPRKTLNWRTPAEALAEHLRSAA